MCCLPGLLLLVALAVEERLARMLQWQLPAAHLHLHPGQLHEQQRGSTILAANNKLEAKHSWVLNSIAPNHTKAAVQLSMQ
jgi:hypothetical protein